MNKNITRYLVAILLLAFGACNKSTSEQKMNVIKIGTIAGPETALMEKIRDELKQRHDINLEIIQFNDFMTPNIALEDGSLDANAFQHLPYLVNFVKLKNSKIVSAGKTFVYPVAAYSQKIKHISELKQDAKVAIPNDPSNEGRALMLLEKAGLIKLNAKDPLLATPQDISENKLALHFIEIDAAQLPRTLSDVDLAVINTIFASAAQLDPTRDGILLEQADSPYANIVAVREETLHKPWIPTLMAVIHSEPVITEAKRLFNNNVIAAQ